MIDTDDAAEAELVAYHAALEAALTHLMQARDKSRRFGWVSTTRALRALIARLSALDNGHSDAPTYDSQEETE